HLEHPCHRGDEEGEAPLLLEDALVGQQGAHGVGVRTQERLEHLLSAIQVPVPFQRRRFGKLANLLVALSVDLLRVERARGRDEAADPHQGNGRATPHHVGVPFQRTSPASALRSAARFNRSKYSTIRRRYAGGTARSCSGVGIGKRGPPFSTPSGSGGGREIPTLPGRSATRSSPSSSRSSVRPASRSLWKRRSWRAITSGLIRPPLSSR